MKHFLYRPILDAIDAREKKIAAMLADANTKKIDAQKERNLFQHKNEEFDQQRDLLLKQAKQEINLERQRLLDEARKAADILSAKRQEALSNEAHDLNQILRCQIQEEVFSIARKVLADLASTNLEACLGEMFARRLRALGGEAKEKLAEVLKNEHSCAIVRSTFELPENQRASLQKALNETFSADISLRFETTPDLIGGIELTTQGQKVAWSIDDYLTSMEKNIRALLQ